MSGSWLSNGRIKIKFPTILTVKKKVVVKKQFSGFMKRNPKLSLRQPESTFARAKGFNKQGVMIFFDILEQLVDESGYSTR